jgi:hypothetical protein
MNTLARRTAILLARTVVAFLFFEGLCSTGAVLTAIARSRLAAERLHTARDPELGWVSTPNLSLPNLYGPGIGLHTNSQGFRADHDFAVSAGARKRIICSGDSFTLGFGVADAHAWCQVLSTLDPRLETVNMGQGGYGVDQAYLWYKRDGARLEHDVHVFAFIAEGFERMQRSEFYGFGKPYLELKDGALVSRNVPVPRGPYVLPWVTANIPRLSELRSVALLRDVYGRVAPSAPQAVPADRFGEILFAVFADLQAINRRKGSVLVLVYLPMLAEYSPSPMDGARAGLAAAAAQHGLLFVDLVPELRKFPPADADRLYLPGETGSRHPSAEGHRMIAEKLYERLLAMPEIAPRLKE